MSIFTKEGKLNIFKCHKCGKPFTRLDGGGDEKYIKDAELAAYVLMECKIHTDFMCDPCIFDEGRWRRPAKGKKS